MQTRPVLWARWVTQSFNTEGQGPPSHHLLCALASKKADLQHTWALKDGCDVM